MNKIKANQLVTHLQTQFVEGLNRLSATLGENKPFALVEWLRDQGTHGGGNRFEARDNLLFNRGSVNVSQIHYDDMPEKKLQNATAISTIIHPKNPHVPSMHMHISFTQLRDRDGYWRIMADLNPAIAYDEDKQTFNSTLHRLAPEYSEEAIAQGEKYFFIPVLKRHRGVAHFYLENFSTGHDDHDYSFAQKMGEGVIQTYLSIIERAFQTRTTMSVQDIQVQLAYHTLYLFQVLTLDRGTTSGLLVHDQNDVGIMGSLPQFVDKALLASWIEKMPKPQDQLLENIVNAIPNSGLIDEEVKKSLAKVVRQHYTMYPKALSLQASGATIPTTVNNHA
jgi:coproporphyrinogen III oxidase